MCKQPEKRHLVFVFLLQVGTGTGIMTHYFNLFVIVPTAVIAGNNEYHIGEGSSITLLCTIENVSADTDVNDLHMLLRLFSL